MTDIIDEHLNIRDTITLTVSITTDTNKGSVRTLLDAADLNLIYGHKYGLLGNNGTGKTTLLKHIYNTHRDHPSVHVFYVDQESAAIIHGEQDIPIFELVLRANTRRTALIQQRDAIYARLEADYSEELIHEMTEIDTQLDAMGADRDESTVRRILHGLGILAHEQMCALSHFSGGYRMRVALAKALYLQPHILLLDEPNNHLDLNAMIWLTDYLANTWRNGLVVVSHDKHFLNAICTDIVLLRDRKLEYFTGNYDSYLHTSVEQERIREKKWKQVQAEIKGMVRKSTPKEKVDVYRAENACWEPRKPYRVQLQFPEPTFVDTELVRLSNATLGYRSVSVDGDMTDKTLLTEVDLDLNPDSKYIIVGANGSGKTTLFRTLTGEIPLLGGTIWRHDRVRIGYYSQHATDALPADMDPVQYIQSLDPKLTEHDIRRLLGTIGLDGQLHHQTIRLLSGGQKSRVLFISVIVQRPHIMLLDEPTNHLDMPTIDALIESVIAYPSAILITTHNIELIERTDGIFQILEISATDHCIYETEFEDYRASVLDIIEESNV